MTEEQDRYFLSLAETVSMNSPDPSSKIGAIVVKDNEVKGYGWNDFPRGVQQLEERWNDRETKLRYVVHAEVNAILNAGDEARGSTIYIHGFPFACSGCAKMIAQADIQRVVIKPIDLKTIDIWREDLLAAETICKEVGIEVMKYV